MRKALWARIYCERRRLVFVTTMAFLAGFLFYIQADLYIQGVHVAFVTGAIYAVVIGITATLVCLLLPSMRFMIEAVAMSRLGLSVFVLANPEIGFRILANPMLTAFLVVFGGALISRAVHGRFQKEYGWKARIMPSSMFRRVPPTLQANQWQYRFVSWLDDASPLRA